MSSVVATNSFCDFFPLSFMQDISRMEYDGEYPGRVSLSHKVGDAELEVSCVVFVKCENNTGNNGSRDGSACSSGGHFSS